MNHEQTSSASSWGFLSSDGKFLPVSALTTKSLEYASKSIIELQQLIESYILTEEYEKCAVIRDEIIRRQHAN
ncbi:hypothetical protein MUY27_03150 [Mucilaginibacter sp. RS28]|uniref:UVR domain-containing protein n=1 Tax=Mucilaginibacter straminoryzae TaxID=2932774 RepID=A0A9X1X028_9SPHI|nr:hypothetical protein [Mucilaginibacter straminoryzae]MCJ8208689.1 hypothetical protein [Mucilaginibacter straminoryzae]